MPIETTPFVPNELKSVIDNLDKRTQPRPFFEAQIEAMGALIERRQAERSSPFVESPYVPGVLLRKSGSAQRIESTLAEPWESVVDFLVRKYRIEQPSRKVLLTELDVSFVTFTKMLRSFGIPQLRSHEYKDPKAGKIAAQWEDKQIKSNRSTKISEQWETNKDHLMSTVHSPEAHALRSKKMTRANQDNRSIDPDHYSAELAVARDKYGEGHQQRMEDKFGEDPISKLRDVFVDRGLGSGAAVEALGLDISPQTTYSWAVSEGVRTPANRTVIGTRLDKFQLTKYFEERSSLISSLPEEQREAVLLLKDEQGKIRTHVQIGELIGISKAAVSLRLIKAKSNLEKVERGKPVYKKAGRPRNTTS